MIEWHSDDLFGSRDDGEEAARQATPQQWKELYFATADLEHELGHPVTSQSIVKIIGRPPGHPSRIAAVHNAWVRSRGLKPTGIEKSDDRHQGHHYTW